MKHITQEQVTAVLQLVYATNVSARDFDALRKMLSELPDCPPSEVKEGKKK